MGGACHKWPCKNKSPCYLGSIYIGAPDVWKLSFPASDPQRKYGFFVTKASDIGYLDALGDIPFAKRKVGPPAFLWYAAHARQNHTNSDHAYTPPPVPPLRAALWSLLDGIWGLLKGSWGVLVKRQIWNPILDPATSTSFTTPLQDSGRRSA